MNDFYILTMSETQKLYIKKNSIVVAYNEGNYTAILVEGNTFYVTETLEEIFEDN